MMKKGSPSKLAESPASASAGNWWCMTGSAQWKWKSRFTGAYLKCWMNNMLTSDMASKWSASRGSFMGCAARWGSEALVSSMASEWNISRGSFTCAQHTEKVRQWHQSEWAHEAPEEGASFHCMWHTFQVHRLDAAVISPLLITTLHEARSDWWAMRWIDT
jgi:hypothetical protein